MKKYKIMYIFSSASSLVDAQAEADYLSDLVNLTCAHHKKKCADLLSNHYWDVVIINAKSLSTGFQSIFQSIPPQNQWTNFLVIGDPASTNPVAESLSPHHVNMIHRPIDKDNLINVVLDLAEKSHQNRDSFQRVILAIGAHPDDIEIGCGGYLALLERQGHALNYLTMTLGEVGGDKVMRKQESIDAAKILRAHLFIKNLKDTCIEESSETIGIIEELVDKVHPTHVLTHSIHDNHQDHRNVHLASVVACRMVPNMSCYESPSSTVEFRPSLFIDITNYLETKLHLIECYKSQIEIRPYLERDLIYSTAQYWGRHSNYGLAEPYEIIKMRGGYGK